MNKNLKLFFLLCVLFSVKNSVHAQLVKEDFPNELFTEKFDSTTSYWTIATNADNFFIIQNGEYILNRKNLNSNYPIFPNLPNEFSDFDLKASVKIEQANNKESSIGLLFMAQSDGKGAFTVEINPLKQYRVKQLVGTTYQLLTGEPKNSGWMNSSVVKEAGAYNDIEVKCANKNYDVYINSVYQLSFSEPSYKSGKMAVIIGSGTKARIDYFTIYSANPNNDTTMQTTMQTQAAANESEETSLTDAIVKLKTQNNKLQKENEELKKQLEQITQDNQTIDVQIKMQKTLEKRIHQANTEIDSLKKTVEELKKYKKLITENENGDIIINLSKSLQTEKKNYNELKSINKDILTINKQLLDSVNTLNIRYKQIKKETVKH